MVYNPMAFSCISVFVTLTFDLIPARALFIFPYGYPLHTMMHNWIKVLTLHILSRLVYIGDKEIKQYVVENNDKCFHSSHEVTFILLHTMRGVSLQGPAKTVEGTDHVSALVCSAPFSYIIRYLSRKRCSQLPSNTVLEDIVGLPGVLVPTGNKDSINRDLERRQSYSIQELCLAQDMPGWVKVAFNCTKGLLKCVKKRISETWKQTDTNVVCSFHLKTVLL